MKPTDIKILYMSGTKILNITFDYIILWFVEFVYESCLWQVIHVYSDLIE